MDVVAQHTCKGSICDASPKNTPTDNAAEGILLDCCCDAWSHGMPPRQYDFHDVQRLTSGALRGLA